MTAGASGAGDANVVRRRVLYSGRVQGVGFRARSMHAAQRFAVTGWVRNRMDGDVELIVEGPAREVDAFLTEVAHRMASFIEKAETSDEQPSGGLTGFSIKD